MEPQSTLSGFSVQTNRASCVFVRQKVFCQTKNNLPSLTVGGFSSKVGNFKLLSIYPGSWGDDLMDVEQTEFDKALKFLKSEFTI